MVTQSMFYNSDPVYMTFTTGIALTILLEGLVQTGGCSIQDMVNFPQPQDVVFRAGKPEQMAASNVLALNSSRRRAKASFQVSESPPHLLSALQI